MGQKGARVCRHRRSVSSYFNCSIIEESQAQCSGLLCLDLRRIIVDVPNAEHQ